MAQPQPQQQPQPQDRLQLHREPTLVRHPKPTLDPAACGHAPRRAGRQARGHGQRKPLRRTASDATVAALERRGVAAMERRDMLPSQRMVLSQCMVPRAEVD